MKRRADIPERGAKRMNKDQGSPKPAVVKPTKAAPKAPAATRPLPARKAPAPKR